MPEQAQSNPRQLNVGAMPASPAPPDAAPPTRARPASPLQSRATQASPLPRERQDAIHRALLAGLPGNAGMKLSPHEYQGVGKKFTIFPGSAGFERGPEWVMAAGLAMGRASG